MGAPGAGRRPLEPVWAGDERSMSTLPPHAKQDVLEGTRAPACQPVLCLPLLSDLWHHLPPPCPIA